MVRDQHHGPWHCRRRSQPEQSEAQLQHVRVVTVTNARLGATAGLQAAIVRREGQSMAATPPSAASPPGAIMMIPGPVWPDRLGPTRTSGESFIMYSFQFSFIEEGLPFLDGEFKTFR